MRPFCNENNGEFECSWFNRNVRNSGLQIKQRHEKNKNCWANWDGQTFQHFFHSRKAFRPNIAPQRPLDLCQALSNPYYFAVIYHSKKKALHFIHCSEWTPFWGRYFGALEGIFAQSNSIIGRLVNFQAGTCPSMVESYMDGHVPSVSVPHQFSSRVNWLNFILDQNHQYFLLGQL